MQLTLITKDAFGDKSKLAEHAQGSVFCGKRGWRFCPAHLFVHCTKNDIAMQQDSAYILIKLEARLRLGIQGWHE